MLEPLPYQRAISEYLRTEEAPIWGWFASNRVQREQADAVRFDLLKSTYRVDRETQPRLYAIAEHAAEKLSLQLPITIYQAHNPQGTNASLAYLPDEAHLVLHGAWATNMEEDELGALFGHELSHWRLWRDWGGQYLIVDQVLAALTNDSQAQPVHFATARLFRLYTEIFCDRGAWQAVGAVEPVVSMLVKIHTGLEEVSADSYLRQAEEIFTHQSPKTDELTHPEAYIRARALKLWSEQAADVDEQVRRMIEGPLAIESLDLIGQQRVSVLTRRLLDALLWPKWIQTEPVLAHARLFFDDYQPPTAEPRDERLADDLASSDESLGDYYCYVLLDFVTVDRDLEELPLAAALVLSERLGWSDRFREMARKELRLRKAQLEMIDQEKRVLLGKIAAGEQRT
jgi:hypothetical protein